jgi:hypothetical protein
MTASLIPLNRITLDPTLTARAERPDELVRAYAADMECGCTFPPLTCFTDGTTTFLIDGWLRYLAAKLLGRSHVEATVGTCSRREMRLHAAAANAAHGTSRTQASQPQIVAHCKVSPALVSGLVAVRARMPAIKAEEAAAKSARETLGLPVKPATPKPAPPRPASPKPPPSPSPNPWQGVLDAKRDDDEPDERDIVPAEPEPPDEDDDGDEFDEFDELDRDRLRERMMRAGRKFARFLDAVGGLTDAEAMALVRADMKATAAREARRGRPEKPPALPPAEEPE